MRHVGLLADAALHVGAQFVEDNLTGHAGDGLFAGRIDFCQDHLVEQRKTVGKILVEIAGAGIEVGLENGGEFASVKHFAQREHALADFRWMVGVVAQEDDAVGFEFEIETAHNAFKTQHAAADFLFRSTGNLGERHSGDAVFDVDAHGHAEFNILDIAKRRDEVKHDASATDAQVFSMKIALVAAVVVATHAVLQGLFHLQVAMND